MPLALGEMIESAVSNFANGVDQSEVIEAFCELGYKREDVKAKIIELINSKKLNLDWKRKLVIAN